MNTYSRLIIVSLVTNILVGCGSSAPDQASALNVVSNYSAHGDIAPTESTYKDAGFKGVNSRNIKLINSFIYSSKYADMDTKEEIQSKLRSLGKILGVSFMGAEEAGAPTREDYLALGISYLDKASDEDLINVNRMLSFTEHKTDFPAFKKFIEETVMLFPRKKKK